MADSCANSVPGENDSLLRRLFCRNIVEIRMRHRERDYRFAFTTKSPQNMGAICGDFLAGEEKMFIYYLFHRDFGEVRMSLIGILAYVFVGVRRS